MPRTLIALALTSLLVPASASLIGNGGFEDGVAYPDGINNGGGVSPPWTNYGRLVPNTFDKTGLDGWDDDTGLAGVFRGLPTPFGNRFVALGFYGAAGADTLTQFLLDLVVGQEYTLPAWMQTDARGVSWFGSDPFDSFTDVLVYFNGGGPLVSPVGRLTRNSESGVWEPRSFTFTATRELGYFTFVPEGDGAGVKSMMVGIDEIALNVVPEPATVVALGAGLVALARRRRPA